ncbi:MAG TPA: glycerol-3-phosphate 1-O-acyltransferase [Candidatus Cloacimonetes bacterium]|nr:glycerol-3-phosphate 1-O-acyltransferase [Candidatus Cloacimonadota bacterium]HEX37609.1 glycerol-3-phosphate 1-O-acyltransferase [Candidatus Cloacimonadota bacterium]
MILFAALLISYLLGAIPSGFILGKLIRKIDIRDHGSKNIGATNVLRILGVVPGIISLVFDFFKGFLALEIGRYLLLRSCKTTILGCNPCFNYSNPQIFQFSLVAIGIVAIIGHIYPIFLNFKGGKGMATGGGVFVNLLPIPSIIAFCVFILVAAISKYISLASLSAIITFFIVELIRNIPGFQEYPLLILTTLIAALIIFRHKENISRLRRGEEHKITFRKKTKE